MSPQRYLALDGLRGVCALSVVFFHCNDFFHSGAFFQHGYLAVDVFFILSGFVISLTYDQKLASGMTTRVFLRSRARRLLPTYWLGAALNVVLFATMAGAGMLATGDPSWMVWFLIPLLTFLLIPDYITPEGMLYPAMKNVPWSLFVEWGAYFAYARGLFRWRTGSLALLCILGWCIMIVTGYYTQLGWCVGTDRSNFLLGLLRCAPAFTAGMVIYRIHRHPLFQRLPVISTELLLVLWLCAAALPAYSATPTLDALVVVIFSPTLICLLVRGNERAPAFCKWFGELSYPLYVVHPGIILLAAFTPIFGLSHGPKPFNALIMLGVCVILAWGVARIARNLAGNSEWLRIPARLGKLRSETAEHQPGYVPSLAICEDKAPAARL